MFKNRYRFGVESSHAVKTMPKLVSGFTIIELLVVIAIFTILTSVVLANYRSFNTNSDFTNTIENVYFALREAQVYGAGGKRDVGAGCGSPPSLFNCAYGVHFLENDTSYYIFIDRDGNRVMDTGELIQTISLGSATTSLTCIRSSGPGACGAGGASVTFKRPSPDAFIAEFESPANSNYGLEVTISNGIKTAKIVISEAGQMSISII